MDVRLSASDWSLLAIEIEDEELSEKAQDAAENSDTWKELVTIRVEENQVAEFKRAYLEEFGEEYVAGERD